MKARLTACAALTVHPRMQPNLFESSLKELLNSPNMRPQTVTGSGTVWRRLRKVSHPAPCAMKYSRDRLACELFGEGKLCLDHRLAAFSISTRLIASLGRSANLMYSAIDSKSRALCAGCTWTFLAPHSELDIGGVRQRAGPKAGELTRRNGRTID
jgi:hypothetical protein